ncbi:MAG: TraX family protein [bacterium]
MLRINSRQKIDKKNTGRNDLIKFIAIAAMVVDHIGLVFFPQIIFLRIIGRIAFPVFAMSIAEGYRYTANFKDYLLRIILLAAVSQIPYMFLFNTGKLNDLFTLALALIFIMAVDKKKYYLALLVIAIPCFISFNYGIYGILMAAIFYYLKSKNIYLLASLSAITVVYSLVYNWPVQLFAYLGFLLIIYLPLAKIKLVLPRYFFYWFYPAHLLLLIILKYSLIACLK